MKKMMIMAMMMTIAISANAMSYNAARDEALFLSDKMAYELGLSNTQYEAVYEINLDYLLKIETNADVFGFWWEVRNRDLRLVLSNWQYDRYMSSAYFYRPLIWNAGCWTFSIYDRYVHGHMFMHRPAVYVSFRGGHNHKGTSFYSGHHFDKPNPPMGHGNHPTAGNGNRPSSGNGNHHPTAGNGNRPSSGNGNHNPTAGNGNHSTSANNGFGSSHRSTTATAPSRSFGSHSSSSTARTGNSAPRGGFGGRR